MIFLIIGIFGYFSVPSIANHILWVGGGDSLTGRATGAAMAAGGVAGAVTGTAASTMAIGASNLAKAPYNIYEGYKSGDNTKESTGYMQDKIKGK
ncbi:hypothetical protein [Niabella ginsengisoli]|uniref:Conjugative transposon TraJ C-terminal domain-containing protein n=1 Tax=Niabella ginsengisoli TaxID=522298 RepID=A0ABS9SHV2_9BACT|nr:hypothetical protein [Niabella ginsengisoli]MCH5597932.1 hypothetical protein [Niabella ginsengisoli]